MGRRIAVLAVAVAACLGVTMLPAAAHVTVNPDEASKGGFTKLAFRVPNERDNADTVRVEVAFPADHPIPFVSVKPHPGWTANVTKAKLATPVTSEDGDKTTEAVSTIVWEGGAIKPNEFDEFEVSAGPLPTDVDSLTFKALQTYSNGEVVRWIDDPRPDGSEPDHPAPVLRLTDEEAGGHSAAGKDAGGTTDTTVATVTAGGEVEPLAGLASKKDLETTSRLTAVALVLGVAALGMSVFALGGRVKKREPAAPSEGS